MMITMQKNKKSLARLSLAVMLLTSVPSVQAFDILPSKATVSNIANKTAYAALLAASIRFWTRKPTNAPVRYNIDELLAGQNVQDNLFFLFDDGIGHAGKDSYAKVDAESGKIKWSEEVAPKGLGWVHFYFKPLVAALGTAAAVAVIAQVITDPATTSANFIEQLGNKVKAVLKENGLFKLSAELGANKMLAAVGAEIKAGK